MKISNYRIDSGEYVFTFAAEDESIINSAPSDGFIEFRDVFGPENYYYSALENGLMPIPPRPSEHHAFDYALKQWVDPRTLSDIKASKRNEINDARLTANESNFAYAGKQIACDSLSRSDIDGANGQILLTGEMPADWPGGWKAMDNSYVPITTVEDWKAFYAAMYDQGLANFVHAQALKAQIEAAETVEEVQAITWTLQAPPTP